MTIFPKFILILILAVAVCSCNTGTKTASEKRTTVEMHTNYGTLILELYNETPLHHDNFIKLVKDGVFDSLLFHRVIENFMIQGGDTQSKDAEAGEALGEGDFPYLVDAEFHPDLFHKKGALAAARTGNLERASSSTQFYIVQGKIFNDSTLNKAEERINNWLAQHYSNNEPENKALNDSLQKATDEENTELYKLYSDSLRNLANDYDNFERYTIPDNHREIYKTLGGTPHLDQNYTVFGEVVKGIEVIDSIAAVQTNERDRPVVDVQIIKIKILDKVENL